MKISKINKNILLTFFTLFLSQLIMAQPDTLITQWGTDIKTALDAHEKKIRSGQDAVQEDLLFHLAIAKACGNSTLNTFMLTITPQIIIDFEKYHVCYNELDDLRIDEHTEIYEAIKKQDPSLAKEKMKKHFKLLYQYCYNVG